MKIAVVGVGDVGLSSWTLFAQYHQDVEVDIEQTKVSFIKQQKLTLYYLINLKRYADLIIAKRQSKNLEDVVDRVYEYDLFVHNC